MIVGRASVPLLPNGVRFRYENDEGLWEVQIIGNETPESIQGIRLIGRQLVWGETALTSMSDITVTKVEEEEET